MINKINSFKCIVEKSYSLSSPYLLPTALAKINEDKRTLLSDLENEKGIKVPVVGDFDAGKSSLINTFIGRKDLLPTAITPETAVAYELYFSTDEKIIHTRNGESLTTCGVDQIKSLTTKPGDIVKVYVNSHAVKNLNDRGIVLVDMPGLGSGIEAHNNAILNYMGKGCCFVFVVDCEAGTITSSTLSFMHELSMYNLKCGVLVSKIDKKPENDIPSLKEVMGYHAKKAVNSEVFVGAVSSAQGNTSDFNSFLDTLDSENIVTEKFGKKIAQYIDAQIFAIKTQIDVLNANIDDVEGKVKELENQKEKIVQDLSGNVINAETPEKSTSDILMAVEDTLNEHAEDIARAIADKQDTESIKSMILSYVRPTIAQSFKEEGEQYAASLNTVVDDISKALQDCLQIEDNDIAVLVDDFRSDILNVVEIAAGALLNIPHIFAKILGGILLLLGEKIPDIVRWFFGKSKDEVLLEIIAKLKESVIVNICDKLRPMILEQVTAQQERIRKSISEGAQNKISQIQDSVRSSADNASKDELESKKNSLVKVVEQLQTIKSEL